MVSLSFMERPEPTRCLSSTSRVLRQAAVLPSLAVRAIRQMITLLYPRDQR